jgi:hypothetical protein
MTSQSSSCSEAGVGSAEPLLAAPCAAVGMLDQSQTDTATDLADILGPPVGVIPPRSGAQTSDVEPITVEIRDTLAGAPGSTLLASTEIAAAGVTPVARWVAVAFADPAIVRSGARYAIVVSTGGRTVYLWHCGVRSAEVSDALWDTSEYPPTVDWDPVTTDLAAFRTYVQEQRRPPERWRRVRDQGRLLVHRGRRESATAR